MWRPAAFHVSEERRAESMSFGDRSMIARRRPYPAPKICVTYLALIRLAWADVGAHYLVGSVEALRRATTNQGTTAESSLVLPWRNQ